ncbi:flagellar biosynthesis anti-sigma factor FlgM [Thiobacillus sp.]
MKIDPGLTPITLPNSVENRTSKAEDTKPADVQKTDVNLSPQALQLKQLESQLAAIPVVDRARVDSIKQAITRGEYTINTGNIAENLLNSVKEMLHVAK